MFELSGKTALVTGASGGIGGAAAKALHQAGATVALSGTRVEALDAVKAELGDRVKASAPEYAVDKYTATSKAAVRTSPSPIMPPRPDARRTVASK